MRRPNAIQQEGKPAGAGLWSGIKEDFRKRWQLLLMLVVPFAYIAIFNYGPMYGIQLAFRKFNARAGIWGSKWIGLENFSKFFNSYQFVRTITNTIVISLYSLIASFPIPIIFALALNCSKRKGFKKTVQMTSYAPYFISTVVMCSIIIQFLSPKFGIVNAIIKILGGQEYTFMASESAFKHIYVWSGIWQNTGWNAIIYIAALSAIDPQLHEAAIVDGATRFQRIVHVDLPGILPTCVILLIMNFGSLMSLGYEKILLLQNSQNLATSETIATYMYKVGLAAEGLPNYGYSTAINLFNSVVNLFLLITINGIARRVSENSLW